MDGYSVGDRGATVRIGVPKGARVLLWIVIGLLGGVGALLFLFGAVSQARGTGDQISSGGAPAMMGVGGVFLLLVLFIYFALLRQSIKVTQHEVIVRGQLGSLRVARADVVGVAASPGEPAYLVWRDRRDPTGRTVLTKQLGLASADPSSAGAFVARAERAQQKLISVLGYCELPRSEWRAKDGR